MKDAYTYNIIGAAMRVHKILGHGFLEKVYQEALAVEFQTQGIPFEKEVPIPIYYGQIQLKTSYRVDFQCFDTILVELKALSRLGPNEIGQTLNYLKATQSKTALLINFGSSKLQYHRIRNRFLAQ